MTQVREFLETSPENVTVRGFLHLAANSGADGLVLTHGAGANCTVATSGGSGECIQRVGSHRTAMRSAFPAVASHRAAAARKRRTRSAGMRAAVACMRRLAPGRIFLGGHSYGGRQSSMLAASEPGLVERLLLLSYPLHPPRRPEELRTAHFPSLQTPALLRARRLRWIRHAGRDGRCLEAHPGALGTASHAGCRA